MKLGIKSLISDMNNWRRIGLGKGGIRFELEISLR